MSQSVFAWLLVSASVVSEVMGTVALKHSVGFTKPVPSALSGLCYLVAIWLMMSRTKSACAWVAQKTSVFSRWSIMLIKSLTR